ncbi:MAG: uroporphyrinogen-III synthase [Dokdonella sp.]
MSFSDRISPHDSDVLADWNVVVTRPRNSATPLIRGLRRHGANVFRLPAQEVQANPEFDWHAAMANQDGIDDWIFTSPSAVSHAMALLERGLPDGHVFAIGASTAASLRRHRIPAIAPGQQHTSEALLDLAGLGDVAGRRVAVVTAAGGRGLIATTLRERGAEVVEWLVYGRRAVAWSQRKLDALAALEDPLLTIVSSGEALDIIATALPPALWQRLRDARWITSSKRLEAVLGDMDAGKIDVAESALARDLVHAALRLR